MVVCHIVCVLESHKTGLTVLRTYVLRLYRRGRGGRAGRRTRRVADTGGARLLREQARAVVYWRKLAKLPGFKLKNTAIYSVHKQMNIM